MGKREEKGWFELAQDEKGEWSWLFWSSNGRAAAMSSDSFVERNDCTSAIETFLKNLDAKPQKIVVVHTNGDGKR